MADPSAEKPSAEAFPSDVTGASAGGDELPALFDL